MCQCGVLTMLAMYRIFKKFLFVVSIRDIYNRLTFGLHVNRVLLRRDRVILNALLECLIFNIYFL